MGESVSGALDRDTIHNVMNYIEGKKDELVSLAVDLGNIYAPTGYEKEIGQFIYNWLEKNGFEAARQEVVKDRFNVIGKMRGTGSGYSLMLNSHMDTDVGAPEDFWILGEELSNPIFNRAWVEKDVIKGRSVVNDRGPMAATMIAAKAIKECGVKLAGDLVLTMVIGEIGQAPIDEFQGPQYLGKGVGSFHLVNSGVVADYVLVAERTAFCITWVEAGDVWFKITVKGKGGIYTPYIERPKLLHENPNAIVKMARLVEAIENWAIEYQERNKYEFAGGIVIPKVNIAAIRGGLPYKASKTPGVCSIYVDVRLPPGKGMDEARRELQRLAEDLKLDVKIEPYLYRRGHEGKNISELKGSVERAHETLFNSKPGRIDSGTTSMWRDINVFNEAGIPAVTYGPPASAFYEGVRIDDLVNASKIYALVAMDICSRQKMKSAIV
jgi:acetylornithine deacetylase/succinyl-diaminopimelate desuccinylase-like protein